MPKINFTGKGKKTKNQYKGDTYITYGNAKMSIPLFSITPRATCPGRTKLCSKYCYGMKAYRMFEQTRDKRHRCTELTMTDGFVDIITGELKNSLIPYVRIHESGDFYDQVYLDKWIEIAKRLPDRKFLAFTKSFHLDFSQVPENMVIYLSLWVDTDMNSIPESLKKYRKAYVNMTYKKYKGKYTDFIPKTAKRCSGLCDQCLICFNNNSDVYFDIH